MARNDWERGELKMSVKEFGSFRRDMIAFHNGQQTQFFTKAQEVYKALKSANEVKDVLFPYDTKTGTRSRRPKAPRKNAFKMLKQNAEGVPVGHEAGITFVKKLRTVIWSVYENNHAVENAHNHPTGKEFFRRLNRVEWTRGTGGEIVGNDEYNTDSREAGRGANYVTSRYGVAKKQFEQSLKSFRRGF
jgi:hypothetical protein